MNPFEYKTYNTAMENEVQLTRALEDAVRWKNYAEDLKKERDDWIAEYRSATAEIERIKLELDEVKLYNKNINDELRKADSHNLTIAAKIQVYEEQRKNEMEDAVNLLQSWIHDDYGPVNDTINFVQAYFSK